MIIVESYFIYNSIGESGASSLSEALNVNSSLTQLMMTVSESLNMIDWLIIIQSHSICNKIGDSGRALLTDAMETNITITSIEF